MSPTKEDDLLAELDSLGLESQSSSAKPKASSKKAPAPTSSNAQDSSLDEDAFAEIEAQLAAKKPSSRSNTPRLSSSTTTTPTTTAKATPASTSVGSSQRNSSEERTGTTSTTTQPPPVRSSAEGGRSFHQSQTAGDDNEEVAAEATAATSGGGWWGSMYSAASAAVKQAETIAKEIRGNEEAQKWAEQVRGNLSNLQSIGTDLRTRAMPTFTSLISHIAPPISAHERLQIHTTHDIQNYPSLDPLIYATFSRVMSQVEGGDLLIIQRGTESRSRSDSSSGGYRGAGVLGGNGASWTDGPWYRESAATRSLGSVAGLKEGTRLVRVSAEAYAKDFFESRGGVEAAAQRATEELSETNPVRSSDIFLAIQAITYQGGEESLFAGDAQGEKNEEGDQEEEMVVFAIYLHDPIHSLSFKALSQPFPAKWANWLDASSSQETSEASTNTSALPESIRELIAAGGVDPREWVVEWMEEILSLGVGVVAQQYVAKRMGVGEGGIGRGKRPAEEEGGGEAARAI